MLSNSVTAIIITLNEESNIRDCLESVKWVDEIVVLDSGSTDNTVAIASEYSDKVFITDWPGFGEQKNRALAKATGAWILSIDADEIVTPELRNEIETKINGMRCDGFSIPRQSSYCGKFLKHGGWWPDRIVRVAKRSKCHFDNSIIHEKMIVDGEVCNLAHPLIHHTYRNLDEVISMINRYSSASAELMYKNKRSSGLGTAIIRALWTFFRTYFLRAGILDGREGFMLAVSNAELAYYKYLKLYYKNSDED